MKNRCYNVVFFLLATLFFLWTGITKVDAQEMSIEGEGRFKSFMPMTALSSASPQYKYLVNNTYDENNLRVTYDGYYAVAMGSYYGVLGDKFIITFSDGTRTPVVKVDEKANAHTKGGRGMTMASDDSIIEPIISTSSSQNASRPDLLRGLFTWGNTGDVYDQFARKESIIKIDKVIGESAHSSQEPTKEEDILDDLEEPLEGETLSLTIADRRQDKVIMYFPQVSHDKLVFLDTEFTESQNLVQAAFIVYDRIDGKDLFFLTSSLNVYANVNVSPEFEKFTGITRGFLGNNGISKDKVEEVINSYIDENAVNTCNALVIGHGINQDLDVLYKSGCDLSADVFDTLDAARRLMKRDRQLKLSDLLLDAGLVQENAHDAYQDTRNLVPVFNNLVYIESVQEEKRMKRKER